jgi:tetratricopeptide (TPR) repeat protein
LLYPKIFKKDRFENIRDEDGRISIAVMPFKNITGDSIYNKWQDSFQNLLIGNLSNTEELSVRSFEVMLDILGSTGNTNYASITPTIASELALKLESSIIVNGSLAKAGQNIRIMVNLVEAETQEIYKSFSKDCKVEDEFIFIADSLSNLLKDFLRIQNLKQRTDPDIGNLINTNSPEAFTYYVQSVKMLANFDISSSLNFALKAVEIDSSLISGYILLFHGYNWVGNIEKAREAFQKAYQYRDMISFRDQLRLDFWKYSSVDKNPQKGLQFLYQLIEMEPQNRSYLNSLGDINRLLQNYDKMIEAYEKYIELDIKWGSKLKWFPPYYELADAYHMNGNHKREDELYRMVLLESPNNPRIIYRQARCALSQGDPVNANKHINNYASIRRQQSGWSDSRIYNSLGALYSDIQLLDKAEEFYRKAYDLDPQNPIFMNNLAWFLIEHDINIEEGLGLVNEALDFLPYDCKFLYTKGVGLYKKGMYEKALELLEKSWDTRPYYNHDHFLLIKEVEQALVKQKIEQ